LVALGARWGDALRVTASGPEAAEAVAALEALAAEGFGDGVSAAQPPRRAPAPAGRGGAGPAAPGAAARGGVATVPPRATTLASQPGDRLQGVAASAGIAIGPARHLQAQHGPPPDRSPDPPDDEERRLEQALATAAD